MPPAPSTLVLALGRPLLPPQAHKPPPQRRPQPRLNETSKCGRHVSASASADVWYVHALQMHTRTGIHPHAHKHTHTIRRIQYSNERGDIIAGLTHRTPFLPTHADARTITCIHVHTGMHFFYRTHSCKHVHALTRTDMTWLHRSVKPRARHVRTSRRHSHVCL